MRNVKRRDGRQDSRPDALGEEHVIVISIKFPMLENENAVVTAFRRENVNA